MTEKEYVIEMLCCLSKEMLENALENADTIPDWLRETDKEYIEEALKSYDDKRFVEMREYQSSLL